MRRSSVVTLLIAIQCAAQNASTPLKAPDPEMLGHYLAGQAKAAAQKSAEELIAIRSMTDLQQWQDRRRNTFLEVIGGLPQKKTDLRPRITGELRRDGYIVRKLFFESLPEFYVTANLYVPTTGKPPFPAVLAPNGHAVVGKAYPEYQRLYIGLVKRGYVVLTWDNLGEGERFQFWDFVFNHRGLTEKSNEHGLMGIREYLLGRNLARELIWDGIRALDYLTSLREVDATRIAVTGNSGGGTLTTYLSLLDSRVRAASIVTYLANTPRKIEERITDAEADPEQDVQGLLSAGLDHPELAALIAPRPVLIGAATRDFFPIDATRDTYVQLRDLYGRLGYQDRVKMVEFDHEHRYSQPLREATTAWFDRWLKGSASDREPPIEIEKNRDLEVTPSGQVLTSLGGKRLVDVHREELQHLMRDLEERRRSPGFRRDLAATIRERLALPGRIADPRHRGTGEERKGSYTVEKILLETEPGILVPIQVHGAPGGGRKPALVYLRDREGEGPEVIEQLWRPDRVLIVADVRGFGDTRSLRNVPDKRMGYFHPRDGMDADFAYAALVLGRPLLGMRVFDALSVLAEARSRSDVDAQRVALAGTGWAGEIAMFAAAVDKRVAAVAVEGVPASWADLFGEGQYAQPVSQVVPGALQSFDIADVFSALAPRPLLIMNVQDAQTRRISSDEARVRFAAVRRAYEGARAGVALEVTALRPARK